MCATRARRRARPLRDCPSRCTPAPRLISSARAPSRLRSNRATRVPGGALSCQMQCIGAVNGTEAIFVALKALSVKPGDEVITAANTFTATADAIEWTGARPVLVDVDPDNHLIDPAAVAAA